MRAASVGRQRPPEIHGQAAALGRTDWPSAGSAMPWQGATSLPTRAQHRLAPGSGESISVAVIPAS